MHLEHAMAVAAMAWREPAADPFRARAPIEETALSRFGADRAGKRRTQRCEFDILGPHRIADTPALRAFHAEGRNLGKTFEGYPQPALVTFRLRFAL